MKGQRKARLFVISAPSGSGKTTLSRKLLDDDLGLAGSVSMTTRDPRRGERDGKDYRFVSRECFRRMARQGGFLEYEENFGHLYGTPAAPVEECLEKGVSVVLSIDVKGAMKVARAYPRESVLIFILPPSMKTLERRLRSRRSDSVESVSQRLELARREIACRKKYDYCIVNDALDSAYRRLRKTVVSELKKT